jgi:hypothetical protein
MYCLEICQTQVRKVQIHIGEVCPGEVEYFVRVTSPSSRQVSCTLPGYLEMSSLQGFQYLR